MNSVYVSKRGIVQEEKLIFPKKYDKTKKETVRSTTGYRKAIIAISGSNTYGHFVADHLCSLILIPASYFINSVILIAFDAATAKTYLKCLGLPYHEVYSLTDEWFYVSEAHWLRAKELINSLNVDGLPNLQKKFYNYFNLSEIAPTKYRILNRIKGIWGRINNIEELTALIQKNYPKYDFQRLDDKVPYSIYTSSKLFAETKLLVTCSGSIVHNSIFMHKNTGVVICGSNLIDYPEINIGYSLDIWMIHTLGNYQHGTIPEHDYNIEPVIPAISYMLYAFENNRFPADAFKKYRYAYNLTDIELMVQKEQKSIQK
ncbi:hypothetical protein TVAG_314870 [Trichomonas vaginalis G3]|uniref:Glycosyltransferase 61 catalytic domain-containing protein n=1 Tax=Trichomonas vaginalis (strain ATCC PRA-98 / G3) TaxID=412133 RepID=A2ETS6_TRIV3|nr:glycosyltransferase family [Trichomonas vaginalis G3]EAY03957.1 hypothetical protein TVAG_314870 [Trichomonas vaginalis G3]KAI5541024.1 glycosyltransferase family [Trichomonas vaginalis G3]|eukprot:XP_001316180.1 hypothetical protein [Trichomonas vaginalis G3]